MNELIKSISGGKLVSFRGVAESDTVKTVTSQRDLLIPFALFGILLVMVIPIPPLLLDLLLTLSITAGLMILMTGLYTTKPLEFSVFPTLLLVATLFRLSLNVASTRLILLNGHEGAAAAGSVIQAFGQFVVGGNPTVGIIIFIILVIINFVVITKGAGRVAEVSARFTLDAMPGKQMSIDADLNAGLIDESTARQRRQDIEREADFYGAMDGASKFVRGDAIAGIIITIINILGGFIIGIVQHSLTFQTALSNYTLLTIGDGLVSQIPALIVSSAAGIVVTRSTSERRLSENVSKELMGRPRPLLVSAVLLFILALVPGLPLIPFALLGVILGTVAFVVANVHEADTERQRELAEIAQEMPAEEAEPAEAMLAIDLLSLEVGYGLIALVDGEQSGELLDRIKSIRRQLAQEMGIIVPPIHIRDNLELKPGGYSILLKGVEIAIGELITGHLLAMSADENAPPIDGIPTTEPAFGLPAIWIPEHQKQGALDQGYTVVDLSTVVATHLTEVLRAQSHDLLGRQETQNLLDGLKKQFPKVLEGVVPEMVSLGLVQKVLQNLLRERVSIRDLLTIVETLAEHAPTTKDPDQLTDHVRQALARTITRQHTTQDGSIPLMMLDQEVEDLMIQHLRATDRGTYMVLDPQTAQTLLSQLSRHMETFQIYGAQPILVVLPALRTHVRRLTERFLPQLTVLSHNEILPDVKLQNIAVVRLNDAA